MTGDILVSTLGTFWCHTGDILVSHWGHFGVITGDILVSKLGAWVSPFPERDQNRFPFHGWEP